MVDLLFVMRRSLSLMEVRRLADEVYAPVGTPVDLAAEGRFGQRCVTGLAEAVPL